MRYSEFVKKGVALQKWIVRKCVRQTKLSFDSQK